MKIKKYRFGSWLLIGICGFLLFAPKDNKERMVEIKTWSEAKKKTEKKVAGEVKVFHGVFFNENQYFLTVYMFNADTVIGYNWLVKSDSATIYTRAFYSWINDTLVRTRLVNPETGAESETYNISGNKGSTSLWVDQE
jgi:hypothetical protein